MFYVLIVSLFAGILSQFIKLFLKLLKKRTFEWHSLDAYGGMPSSHAAFLLSLLTAVGLTDGFDSTMFAVAFIITAILIRDALGIRMILEDQGKLILRLIDKAPETPELDKEKKEALQNHRIGHRIGHTIPEIIVGSIIGVAVAVIGYYIFFQI